MKRIASGITTLCILSQCATINTTEAHYYPSYVRIGRDIVSTRTSPRRRVRVSTARVVHVIDGSVILIEHPNGYRQEVRLLGSEAPEIIRPETGQLCYSLEAREYLRRVIEGRTVSLIKEEGYQYDSMRRLVRYVEYRGRDINKAMIRYGFAFAEKGIEYARRQTYVLEEYDAREDDRGLWSFHCDYDIDADEQIRISQ